GNAAWVLQARTLPKTLAVAALVILAIAALFLFPWPFRMKASGSLQPVERKLVFSNASGKVVEVLKDHGDVVRKGDTLLRLENPKLQQSLAQVQGEIAQYQKQVKQAQKNRNNPLLNEEQKQNAVIEGVKASISLQTAMNKLKLIELELADLVVASPIDGQILDFKTKENLLGRPVQPGDNVMTIARLDGEWMLELFIPESNVGHVSRNMPEDANELMEVEYFLMSDPENKYEGTLNRSDVHDMAQLHEEHGHSVRMLVDIDENDLVDPRPGTEISARVYCGKEPIGYVWFHKLIEFVQSRWIF
ncbi:MAG: HlyD family efflux transporter periplasmic adaptor subunit, partial [Planctomycetota bacterium]